MTAPIIVPDNHSFMVAAKQLKERGVISKENYHTMLSRERLRQ